MDIDIGEINQKSSSDDQCPLYDEVTCSAEFGKICTQCGANTAVNNGGHTYQNVSSDFEEPLYEELPSRGNTLDFAQVIPVGK